MVGRKVGRKPGTAIDSPELREKFLEVLRQTGNVGTSAAVCNIYRTTPYQWKAKDKEFAQKWEEAMDAAADVAEAEVRRRAIEGWDEPVFYKGAAVGSIRRFSDRMLELHIKALKPEKYRENVNTTAPILIQVQGIDQIREIRATNPWAATARGEAIDTRFVPLQVKTDEVEGRNGLMEHMRSQRDKGLTAEEEAEKEEQSDNGI